MFVGFFELLLFQKNPDAKKFKKETFFIYSSIFNGFDSFFSFVFYFAFLVCFLIRYVVVKRWEVS